MTIANCYLQFQRLHYMVMQLMFDNKMYNRMLAVHCDQNDSCAITINDFEAIKINDMKT